MQDVIFSLENVDLFIEELLDFFHIGRDFSLYIFANEIAKDTRVLNRSRIV